jgi:hypothetical protein
MINHFRYFLSDRLALLSRLKAFLPKLAADNERLQFQTESVSVCDIEPDVAGALIGDDSVSVTSSDGNSMESDTESECSEESGEDTKSSHGKEKSEEETKSSHGKEKSEEETKSSHGKEKSGEDTDKENSEEDVYNEEEEGTVEMSIALGLFDVLGDAERLQQCFPTMPVHSTEALNEQDTEVKSDEDMDDSQSTAQKLVERMLQQQSPVTATAVDATTKVLVEEIPEK